jgi:hypothetical protein
MKHPGQIVLFRFPHTIVEIGTSDLIPASRADCAFQVPSYQLGRGEIVDRSRCA